MSVPSSAVVTPAAEIEDAGVESLGLACANLGLSVLPRRPVNVVINTSNSVK